MFGFLKNRVTEKDVRDWLSENGYAGNSARFDELELHAIQRPGWYQIYRFVVQAKHTDGDWKTIFGTARDDERFNLFDVEIFTSRDHRDDKLEDLSQGMIVAKRR